MGFFGAAGRIRTHDPLVRSQVLYPTELQPREPRSIAAGARQAEPGGGLEALRGARRVAFALRELGQRAARPCGARRGQPASSSAACSSSRPPCPTAGARPARSRPRARPRLRADTRLRRRLQARQPFGADAGDGVDERLGERRSLVFAELVDLVPERTQPARALRRRRRAPPRARAARAATKGSRRSTGSNCSHMRRSWSTSCARVERFEGERAQQPLRRRSARSPGAWPAGARS